MEDAGPWGLWTPHCLCLWRWKTAKRGMVRGNRNAPRAGKANFPVTPCNRHPSPLIKLEMCLDTLEITFSKEDAEKRGQMHCCPSPPTPINSQQSREKACYSLCCSGLGACRQRENTRATVLMAVASGQQCACRNSFGHGLLHRLSWPSLQDRHSRTREIN